MLADEEMQALISAAAEVIGPAHLPLPSRRSRVALYPADGSARALSMLAPREVRGSWVADAPNALGWAVTLGERSVTFQNGLSPSDATTHAITSVRWTPMNDGLRITVEYVNGWTSVLHGKFTFYWNAPGGELTVPGAGAMAWRRTADGRR